MTPLGLQSHRSYDKACVDRESRMAVSFILGGEK